MAAPRDETESLVFLDACSIINLFATGLAGRILRELPHRFFVARYVAETEILEILGEPDVSTAEPDEPRVALHPLLARLVEDEVVEMVDITSAEEERHLVRFAVDLDDGEAHTCALAFVRSANVATDDRKAIRVYGQAWRDEDPSLPGAGACLRTSDLLFSWSDWSDAREIAEVDLVRVVRSVARRARFIPPRSDPHYERWIDLLTSGTP